MRRRNGDETVEVIRSSGFGDVTGNKNEVGDRRR